MAIASKILGQVSDASSEAELYAVPAVTRATVSSIVVCNRASVATTFRIAVLVGGGGAAAVTDYLYFDLPLPPNDTFIATIGATLATTDSIRVLSGSANVTFNAFGIETT